MDDKKKANKDYEHLKKENKGKKGQNLYLSLKGKTEDEAKKKPRKPKKPSKTKLSDDVLYANIGVQHNNPPQAKDVYTDPCEEEAIDLGDSPPSRESYTYINPMDPFIEAGETKDQNQDYRTQDITEKQTFSDPKPPRNGTLLPMQPRPHEHRCKMKIVCLSLLMCLCVTVVVLVIVVVHLNNELAQNSKNEFKSLADNRPCPDFVPCFENKACSGYNITSSCNCTHLYEDINCETRNFGPFGGKGGKEFEDKLLYILYGNISSIEAWLSQGKHLVGFRMKYGTTVDGWSKLHGMASDTPEFNETLLGYPDLSLDIDVGRGERITNAITWTGVSEGTKVIKRMLFVTSMDRMLEFGGFTSDERVRIDPVPITSSTNYLMYVSGKYSRYVDSLNFFFNEN